VNIKNFTLLLHDVEFG